MNAHPDDVAEGFARVEFVTLMRSLGIDPTREQIAVGGLAIHKLQRNAAAKALCAFADGHRLPGEWVMFRGNGRGVTVSELLRETAARIRGDRS